MNIKINKSLSRKIKKEYLTGSTSTELASKYGVTHQAILYNLHKSRVAVRPPRARALYDDAKQTAQIIKLYQKGHSMVEIAKMKNVTDHTINRVLEKNNLSKRPRNMRPQTITMPLSAGTLGYIAGMFDGEGNLQFRDKHNTRNISSKIAIYSTTPGIVEWFQKTMSGGKVLWNTARVKKHGWKPIGSWCLYRAQDVAAFLVATRPYLLIKKEDADKALKLFSKRFQIKTLPL